VTIDPTQDQGPPEQPADDEMVEIALSRIVLRDGSDQQHIFLQEKDGLRGFPIVIGIPEALEIQRVVTGVETPRPLTHQLAFSLIDALGAEIRRVDIVALRDNTFFAQVVLTEAGGEKTAVVDARPSDALALALRAGCPLRVAASILEEARTDQNGPDPLPEGG
jgi:bifunctional DNase/RNase